MSPLLSNVYLDPLDHLMARSGYEMIRYADNFVILCRAPDEAAQEVELRLVIGQLEEFASRVSQGLQEPDWTTRREIVRALVKKVEVDEQEVRIVYRVSPSPFEGGPQQGRSQHCWGRDFTPPGEYLPVSYTHLTLPTNREV